MINRHLKVETISKLTVHSQLLKNYIFSKNLYFVNDEGRDGYPKLGHTSLNSAKNNKPRPPVPRKYAPNNDVRPVPKMVAVEARPMKF